MSGIAGVTYSDGQTVSDNSLWEMLDSMAYRGPDGSSFVNLGRIGFIHLMAQNIPESTNETLPYQSADKQYLITFHGRIDNRKEIYDLTDQSQPISQLPDSQLVLDIYRFFGKECACKLIGDFSFAIWDNAEQLLYCARDQMGVKPFFFIKTDSFFAFASEIKALLTLPGVSRKLNRERLADFLVCIATERRMTIYNDIFKLQPAHYLIFHKDYFAERRYWQLEPYDLQFSSEKEYDEAFYELFKESVRLRLRTCKPIGSFLSGGIDSSSIVCMAAGPLENEYSGTLNTFTGIYPRLYQCDERKFFQPVIDRYPIIPNYVFGDNLSPELAFDQTALDEDEPFFGPHFFVKWQLMMLAQKKGIRIMLDGHDGDSAFSSGEGLLPELAMQGRIFRLASELMGFPHATYKRVLSSIKDIYIDLFLQKLPFTHHSSLAKRIKLRQLEILSPELLQTTNVRERVLELVNELPDSIQKEQERHFFNVTQPMQAYALEFLERLSSRFEVCSRFPAFDIRLIAFCLSLPADKKLKDGFSRNIVRNSLHNILPLTVRGRKEKTNFGVNLVDAYTVRGREWFLDSYRNAPASIYKYMNKRNIDEAMERCISNSPDISKLPDLTKMFFFLALSKWMQKAGVDC